MTRIGRPPQNQLTRFWGFVDKSNGPIVSKKLGRCWVWTASLINGYGQFPSRDYPTPYAHRTSWQIHTGVVPNKCVLHACDNRMCVRPSHLFLGTKPDNVSDCVKKGRNAKGERVNTAILTDQGVQNIRKDYQTGKFTQKQLSLMAGVSQVTISRIVTRKNWKHI